MEASFAVMNTTQVVVKIRPEKNLGLYGIWTYDLCDIERNPMGLTGTNIMASSQLSCQLSR